MGFYCCFFHPGHKSTQETLEDKCPDCGRPYRYPLDIFPSTIINPENNKEYNIIESLDRGFYGATYLCEVQRRFSSEKTLLKVMPKAIYEFFQKDFYEECNNHSRIANGTSHIVQIEDAFEADLDYDGEIISCYIAELQYINGLTFDKYISKLENVTPRNFAQIAIDVLSLWAELIKKRHYHNDLHSGNLMIETLDSSISRINALIGGIKVYAIDLNSAADMSVSNAEIGRIGDKRFISNHIMKLASTLRENHKDIDSVSDADYRLIETLEKVANILLPAASAVESPTADELIKIIQSEFSADLSYTPWTRKLGLSQISEGLNAQTIHSCYIPKLLVDPDETWLNEISVAGPELIIGMRGCGKTMLLGSLDIHARIEGSDENESKEAKISRLKADSFIGIMASCRKLLLSNGQPNKKMFEVLFWQYALEIVRAARHLQHIDESLVRYEFISELRDIIEVVFGINASIDNVYSLNQIEKYLYFTSSSIYVEDNELKMKVMPTQSFEMLARVYKGISRIFSEKKVLFLLDDASTRYLPETDIRLLLKSLIFQSPECAFKITTERQTLDLGINSPGDQEFADEFRDYKLFDLGAKVYSKTKDPIAGKKFVLDILTKRTEYYPHHPSVTPSGILGDCTLIDIARNIRESKKTSNKRKEVYHGITALTAMCVGDIGDIITLYDLILQRDKKIYPIPKNDQTTCFQELCSRRMYNLENRNTSLQKYALTFAEASYALMMKSEASRIRQYTHLYVKLTSKDREVQSKKIRELIDAGIFVFTDSGTPRAKTNDTNPMLQFKLAFRKLFGISNYIGLSSSDRFELSGKDLKEWLESPSKEILTKNLGLTEPELTQIISDISFEDDTIDKTDRNEKMNEVLWGAQLDLFSSSNETSKTPYGNIFIDNSYIRNRVSIQNISVNRVKLSNQNKAVIFGLGFEECSLASTKRVLEKFSIKRAILIEYDEIGRRKQIENEVYNAIEEENITSINYRYLQKICDQIDTCSDHDFIIDATALTKPIIFSCVRHMILKGYRYTIALTKASGYYPLESDISQMIESISEADSSYTFSNLMRQLYVGEKGPYELVSLINRDNEISSRPNALIGFLPSQNQRLFSFLDQKEYEYIKLIIPSGNTYNDRLAEMAAQVARVNYENTDFQKIEYNNYNAIVEFIATSYDYFYNTEGMNVDLALTGSKIHAALCAAISTKCRIHQCWYVQPKKYDVDHFSEGVESTDYFRIFT